MALTTVRSTGISSLPAISAANLTSIPAANITGTLPAISGANLTGISGGKVLQIQRKELPTTVYVTGTSATDIMNQTITPSATSSYIYALFVPNYIMSCNDNTSNPYGNVRIKQDSTTTNTKADSRLRDINSAGATNITRQFTGGMSAYWTPNTTSQITVYVTVEMGTTTGRIGHFGNNEHTNATTLTLFEIGA
tara:strand:+ start:14 stop:595 length:582 start_codon:yes stop_codon:yes gene_type:complete